jgi:anti-sigma B factor antagonist
VERSACGDGVPSGCDSAGVPLRDTAVRSAFEGMTSSMTEQPQGDAQIHSRREAGCLVVEVLTARVTEGPVIDSIQQQLSSLLGEDVGQRVVLDLSRVEIMSSAMLSVLVQAYRHLAESSGRLILCGLKPPVLKVFEITRLDQLFRLEADVPAALARLASSSAGS